MSARPNLLVIRVGDLASSRAFYEALGVELRSEKHGTGPAHWTHDSDGFVFEIYPRRTEADSTSAVRLGFSVPALAPIMPRLAALGAEIVTPPQESEWGLRAVVRDQDGHVVELREVAR